MVEPVVVPYGVIIGFALAVSVAPCAAQVQKPVSNSKLQAHLVIDPIRVTAGYSDIQFRIFSIGLLSFMGIGCF